MTCLIQTLQHFLKERGELSRPLLLALSGGPDSMALFDACFELSKKKQIFFHVAHVDHSWREESTHEADVLEAFMKERGIPFHRKKLPPSLLKGNWEEACRQFRLAFFQELGFHAVLLAHHADDQAETVLKRLFEGSSVTGWGGIREETVYNGMRIWRPFLQIPKKILVTWLSNRGIPSFEDPTNADPLYLRSRMRHQTLPLLSKQFGKEVTASLGRVAKEAQELALFLEMESEEWRHASGCSGLGKWWDWTDFPTQKTALLRFLLHKILSEIASGPPRGIIDPLIIALQEKKADVCFSWKEKKILADRGRLFLFSSDEKRAEGAISLKKQQNLSPPSSWKEAWTGVASVSLPEGEYHLAPASPNTPFGHRSTTLSKWWTNHQVPATLRDLFPVLWQGDRVIHEFLTGRQRVDLVTRKEGSWREISVKFHFSKSFE